MDLNRVGNFCGGSGEKVHSKGTEGPYLSGAQSTEDSLKHFGFRVPCRTLFQCFILGPDNHKETFVWFKVPKNRSLSSSLTSCELYQ